METANVGMVSSFECGRTGLHGRLLEERDSQRRFEIPVS